MGKLALLQFSCCRFSSPHTSDSLSSCLFFSVPKQSDCPGKPSRRCFGSAAANSITNSAAHCNYYSSTLLYENLLTDKSPIRCFGVHLNLLYVQEIKTEVNMGTSPRQLPVDPSTVYGQGILQSKPGMGSAGKYIQFNAF